MNGETALLLRLIIAHIIADFFFQTSKKIEQRSTYKFRSSWLYLHGAIVFVLTIALSVRLDYWWIFLCLALSHVVIDGIKSYLPETTMIFIADQTIHLSLIFAAWVIVIDLGFFTISEKMTGLLSSTPSLVYILSILLVTYPVGYFIKIFISRWNIGTIVDSNKDLKNAGFWIGCFERILILVFVYLDRWEAVGLLITAKSIIRFGENKTKSEEHSELKYSEYILLGSLVSFLSAIIVGLIGKTLI